MDTNTPSKRPSLLKQLLGAVGGAVIALLIYQGYTLAAPVLTAWLVAPQSQIAAEHPGAVRVNQELDDYKYNRVAARAKEIYARFAAELGPQASVLPEGIEVTQPLAQSSSAIAFIPIVESSSSVAAEPAEVFASSATSFEDVLSVPAEEAVAPVVEEVAVAASSARSMATAQHITRLADKRLPQSGVGTAVAAIMALGATAAVRKRKTK